MNIEQYLLTLLDEAEKALAECGRPPVCRSAVYPGAQAVWDQCGPCDADCMGMLYVRSDVAFPFEVFPNVAADGRCALPMAHQIELGIVRCAPMMDDEGEPPAPDDITDAALGLLGDQRALRVAISRLGSDKVRALVNWQPQGPQGGCVGGSWAVIVDPAGIT